MTAVLQLLVVALCAVVFAAYLLWQDKREHPPQPKPKEEQQSIYFPEHRPTDDREQRGAAMSRL